MGVFCRIILNLAELAGCKVSDIYRELAAGHSPQSFFRVHNKSSNGVVHCGSLLTGGSETRVSDDK